MPKATRTLNPLHFEDLEPHRFEDLVRQLAYDFKEWRSLEATGRLGADEGIDIRAIEAVKDAPTLDDPSGEDPSKDPQQDRTWIIQCKREKRLGPKDAAKIVAKAIPRAEDRIHGFILAAACDLSKKTRDAFYAACRTRTLEAAIIWGKAELEDMLVQPKNDHLLFAYFGISLQIRRRTIRTEVRCRIALKKKLIDVLGGIRQSGYKALLIRDPSDTDYPEITDPAAFVKRPQWRYYEFAGHEPPDHVAVIVRKYCAYLDDERKTWDALLDLDMSIPHHPGLAYVHRSLWHDQTKEGRYRLFWMNIEERNRAWFEVRRCIPYERIVAIDELGDSCNEGPHLLVEFRPDGNPFEPMEHVSVSTISKYDLRSIRPTKANRKTFFPDPLPSIPPTTDTQSPL